MLTFLNIQENLKLLLTMQGLSYIADTRKELNAITKFTMEGYTPDYVMELIGKLIEIKRHSKFQKDSFWQGCAVNLSDLYSYRVKIETVYPTISTNCHPEPVEGRPTTNSIIRQAHHDTPTWENFLLWSKKLTQTSQAQIAKMTATIDDKLVLITGNPDDHLARLITIYFGNARLGVVFKIPKSKLVED